MKLESARGLGWLAGCLLAVAAAPAAADVIDGEVTFGGRAISGDTHAGKFNEYRDLQPGAFGSTNFLLGSPNGRTFLWGDFENIGYDDQRYQLEFGEWGKLRLFGEYSELPHLYSTDARSLYTGTSLLLFPDTIQGDVEAAVGNAAKSAVLGAGLAGSPGAGLRYDVRNIMGGLVFDPCEDFEFETAYRSIARNGRRPFNMSFGFGNFTSFAAPKDERTDEVTADVRWGQGPFNLEVGYLGSFFQNDFDRITADNPVRLTDSATAPAQGRLSVAPDNSLNQFHATGTYELPLQFPARVATTFSYGLRQQDDDFLPHTINSAIMDPSLVLPRNSLDGKVQTYLANVVLTARPLPALDLRGRYRYYEYNNDTPVIEFPAQVLNDQNLEVEEHNSIPYEYGRQQASFDAAYRFSRMVRLRAGPFWDRWSRSQEREVSTLDEYGGKAALDLTPASWATVRLSYLFGTRDGSDYNPWDAYVALFGEDAIDDAMETGQFSELRKFDEADRIRNEIRFLTKVMPRDDFDVSFSGGWSKYDYHDTAYGVKNDQRWNAGTEISYQPVEWFSASAWYSFEHIELDQQSRYRPVSGDVTTNDPVNDWSSESTDLVHTVGARLGFVIVPEKLDLDFSYVFEHGDGETHAQSAAGCVGAPPTDLCIPDGPDADGGFAQDFPDIQDRLHVFSTVLRYHFTESLTLEGMYAFEKLSLSDYRTEGLNPYMPDSNINGSGIISPSLDVFLGQRYGDYKAHIFALSATYRF